MRLQRIIPDNKEHYNKQITIKITEKQWTFVQFYSLRNGIQVSSVIRSLINGLIEMENEKK